MSDQVLVLMRGLPSSGKSFTAKQIAGNHGVVLETDQYFYEVVGSDPKRFDYNESLLPHAREWVFQKLCIAIDQQRSPIILDRGNGRNPETKRFALYARDHGYLLQLREPDSPWWQELRVLLKYKEDLNSTVLDAWAERLSTMNRSTHRVPASVIRRWMESWKSDLTIEQILNG